MTMGQNPNTLTAANSIVKIRCKGVYEQYVQMQGFQTDNAFGFSDVTIGETRMGVDGLQSGGYVASETPWALYLEANSPSIRVLENCRKDFNANKENRPFDIIVEIPSTKTRYAATGFLVTMSGGSSAQKLLAGSVFNFNMVVNGSEEIN